MESIKMKTEYGGYEIKWSDWHKFIILKEGVEIKNEIETLEECQKWIDLKNKQKFKRVQILHRFRWSDEWILGEATSIVDESHVWISSGKERTKIKINDVWLDTPENRNAVEEIKKKKQQIEKLGNEIKEIEEKTVRLSADMMKEEN